MSVGRDRTIEKVATAIHPLPDQERAHAGCGGNPPGWPGRHRVHLRLHLVPFYHQHPDVLERHSHLPDIQTQTGRAMENIKLIIDHQGFTWRHVVKVTKYLTGLRDLDGIVEVLVESFGDWTPGNTTICVNSLSTPGARVELDMIAIHPKA